MKSRLQKQSIRIQKEDLIDASSQMGIVPAQAEKLWSLLNANVKPGNLFNLSNTVWYLGVLVLFFALIFLGYQG